MKISILDFAANIFTKRLFVYIDHKTEQIAIQSVSNTDFDGNYVAIIAQ